MLCACHGEPCYWQKDARLKAGGFWECRVKRRAYTRSRYMDPEFRERACRQKRDRYDNDPVYRITKRLTDDARARRRRLNERKEALRGEIPHEG